MPDRTELNVGRFLLNHFCWPMCTKLKASCTHPYRGSTVARAKVITFLGLAVATYGSPLICIRRYSCATLPCAAKYFSCIGSSPAHFASPSCWSTQCGCHFCLPLGPVLIFRSFLPLLLSPTHLFHSLDFSSLIYGGSVAYGCYLRQSACKYRLPWCTYSSRLTSTHRGILILILTTLYF